MFGVLKQSASIVPAGTKSARLFGASAVQLKKRDPSVPVAPKGPPTPYTLFVKEWFPANKTQHTGPEGKFDLKTISTAMGNAWSALTDTDKESFTTRSKDLRKAWDAEYKKWYNALDAETIKAVEESTGKKLSPPGGKKAKKQEEADRPGNPGRPLTAFFEFLKEYRAGEGKDLSVTEAAKSGGEKWRGLGEAEQQKYRDLAAASKSKYLEWQKTLQ